MKRLISRRDLFRTSLAACCLAAVDGLIVEPDNIEVTRRVVPLVGLADGLAGYRIAHVTDIHAGDWLDGPRLQRLQALVNDLDADLIAFTGDLVTRDAAQHAGILHEMLTGLKARDGVVGVLGNHDHWTDPALLRAVLRAANVRELGNTHTTIARDGGLLHVAGVDDPWERKARLDEVLAGLPAGAPAVMLAHEPDYADTVVATGRFGLQLSGHSHGGQVALPFIGPLVVPPMAVKYRSGRYRLPGMEVYTSRGVGSVGFRSRWLGGTPVTVRFNCRPEVAISELRPA